MVDTLEKPEQIVIPPGTSSETIITLSRKGSHQLGNPTYRGDHHVHIQVRSRQHFCQHFRQHFLDQTAKTINGSTTRSNFRICKR